jgi:seryl-tRNA synthetase
MTSADTKLNRQFYAWRSLCPKDITKVEDVRKAAAATIKLHRDLTSAKSQFKGKSTDFEKLTAGKISEMLATVKNYRKELEELAARLNELKRWLAKVRTSASPLPFALVAKGNSKGELHVHKTEKRVERGARAGKQEISGAKIHEGECQYADGKLVFNFDDGPRAPWKSLLQGMVNQAGINMKVALDGLGEDNNDGGKTVA